MKMRKIAIGFVVLAMGLVIIFSFRGKSSENVPEELNYEINQKWELPDVLQEISGIAWMGENLIACVQDEDGIIFVYNLATSKVENSIPFGEAGDYEGITLIGDNAYILRSDGVIYEVAGFKGANPQVKKYETKMRRLPGINIEGLCADPSNKRLLLAVKDRKDLPEQKEVYAFNIESGDSESNALFTVNLTNPIFNDVKGKTKNKFIPGEIAIHPHSGNYFILDGSRPKILIVDRDGTHEELFLLRPEDFGNPEGLTFSPEGDLYISNEAEGAPANILKVSLKR